MALSAFSRVVTPTNRARLGDLSDRLEQAGLVARGVVYLLLAWLVVDIGMFHARHEADRRGVLRAVAAHSFGRVVLVALAVGFAAYALWGYLDVVLGRHRETKDKAKRVRSLGTAVLYSGFLATVVGLLLHTGSGGSSSEAKSKSWTARVLAWPGGRALVVLGALVAVGIAGALFVYAYKRDWAKKLSLHRLSSWMRKVVLGAGVAGMTVRALIVAVVGLSLARAAFLRDPNQATGVDGALRTIAGEPAGRLLLILCGLGLAAFAVFSWAKAALMK